MSSDKMASRLQKMAKNTGCPLGLDIIDWAEAEILRLRQELRRAGKKALDAIEDRLQVVKDENARLRAENLALKRDISVLRPQARDVAHGGESL